MSTGGLYNADGTFVPFSAADLSTELATRQNAGMFFRGTGRLAEHPA